MDSDPEQKKLDELTARIREARKSPSHPSEEKRDVSLRGGQVGYEFLGSVLGCMLLGWLADDYLHTTPWATLGMMMVGFLVGMLNIWRTFKAADGTAETNKKDGKA